MRRANPSVSPMLRAQASPARRACAAAQRAGWFAMPAAIASYSAMVVAMHSVSPTEVSRLAAIREAKARPASVTMGRPMRSASEATVPALYGKVSRKMSARRSRAR